MNTILVVICKNGSVHGPNDYPFTSFTADDARTDMDTADADAQKEQCGPHRIVKYGPAVPKKTRRKTRRKPR